jgi:hypothetical protein
MMPEVKPYPDKSDDITNQEIMDKAIKKAQSIIQKEVMPELSDRDPDLNPISDKEQKIIDTRMNHLASRVKALAIKIYPDMIRQERLKYQKNMKTYPIEERVDLEGRQVIVEGRIFDLIYLYQFLKRLVTPFKKTKAYELGIIDADGNVLIKRKDLTTSEQRDAYTMFDTLVFNLKKLLGKIPGGKSTIATMTAALLLLKEEKNKDFLFSSEENNLVLEDRFHEMFEYVIEHKEDYSYVTDELRPILTEMRMETEDMTTAAVPTLQEPIVSKQAARKYKKKNKEQLPSGGRKIGGVVIGEGDEECPGIERHGDFVVFVVDVDTFNAAKIGKRRFDRYSKYVGSNELGEKIRQYGRNNPKMPVILKDEKSGQLCFLKYGSTAVTQMRNYYNKDQS